MKTKYWALLLAGVLVVSLGLSFLLLIRRNTADSAEIYSGGAEERCIFIYK